MLFAKLEFSQLLGSRLRIPRFSFAVLEDPLVLIEVGGVSAMEGGKDSAVIGEKTNHPSCIEEGLAGIVGWNEFGRVWDFGHVIG